MDGRDRLLSHRQRFGLLQKLCARGEVGGVIGSV
jgi:hypothetical protein